MAKTSLSQKARIATIPAPIGGLNGRDPVARMPPTDAVALVNMIPSATGLQVRGGSSLYKPATSAGAAIGALMPYTPASGALQLFAAFGGGIYDATVRGAFGAPVVAGLSGSTAWQSVNFGTPGGHYLICANGSDAPRKYDGSTWSTVSLVAPQPATYANVAFSYPYTFTPSKLFGPTVYGSRLWFLQASSLVAWFLPIDAIGSSAQNPPAAGSAVPDLTPCAQAYDFSSLCRLGGSLAAMAVWTHVTTYTITEFAVFITTMGEVLAFSGPDPTIATGTTPWTLIGLFRLAPPIGNRCVLQYGADLAVLTQQGVIPLSSVLTVGVTQEETVAISDKIRVILRQAYIDNPTAFGWALVDYPKGALVMVNVPNTDGSFSQYAMSADTQAWTQFEGLNARCWALLGDNLFFGTSNGQVWQYDVEHDDNGSPIAATVLPAYTLLKSPLRKRVLLARLLYSGPLGYRPAITVKTDYDVTTSVVLPQGTIPPAHYPWGSPWGTLWEPLAGSSDRWQSVRGIGQALSVLVEIESLNPFRLDQIDISYETGGYF